MKIVRPLDLDLVKISFNEEGKRLFVIRYTENIFSFVCPTTNKIVQGKRK